MSQTKNTCNITCKKLSGCITCLRDTLFLAILHQNNSRLKSYQRAVMYQIAQTLGSGPGGGRTLLSPRPTREERGRKRRGKERRSLSEVMLPSPGIWRRWKPISHQTTSTSFQFLSLLLRLRNSFRNSLTLWIRSAITVLGFFFSHFCRRGEMLHRGGQYGHSVPTKCTGGRSNWCRNEITKWDKTLSALHSPCVHILPNHHHHQPPGRTLHPSTVQSQHASLYRSSNLSPGSLQLCQPRSPLCTPPASSAKALPAPRSFSHTAARLPGPASLQRRRWSLVHWQLRGQTTSVLSHLYCKSLAAGTSPRFLKDRVNLWCNKYDLK